MGARDKRVPFYYLSSKLMHDPHETLRKLIESIAASVVGDEAAVKATFTQDDKGLQYTVDCNPADARFLIGKQGSMANAVRTIARAYGQKYGFVAAVEFNVPARTATTSSNTPAAVAA